MIKLTAISVNELINIYLNKMYRCYAVLNDNTFITLNVYVILLFLDTAYYDTGQSAYSSKYTINIKKSRLIISYCFFVLFFLFFFCSYLYNYVCIGFDISTYV